MPWGKLALASVYFHSFQIILERIQLRFFKKDRTWIIVVEGEYIDQKTTFSILLVIGITLNLPR